MRTNKDCSTQAWVQPALSPKMGLHSRVCSSGMPSTMSWLDESLLLGRQTAVVGASVDVLHTLDCCFHGRKSCGWASVLPSSPAATPLQALVAPYLQEGQLHIKMHFLRVDQVRFVMFFAVGTPGAGLGWDGQRDGGSRMLAWTWLISGWAGISSAKIRRCGKRSFVCVVHVS